MTRDQQIQWCIDQHRNTNHMYDMYLPYEFHLRMVVNVYKDFKDLLEPNHDHLVEICELAAWGHDLIEDTRVSYGDVKKVLGEMAANIIYAVSNEKGKNRKERANAKYYEGIRNTEGAIFIKVCDRVANVQYSKMSKSRMFEMYREENKHFMEQLGYIDGMSDHKYLPIFKYLINLFKN